MKTSEKLLLLFFISSIFTVFSQQIGGGEFVFNESHVPCLTEDQRAEIVEVLKESQNQLKRQNKLLDIDKQASNPLFIWPVRQTESVPYDEIWALSNYVDHNPAYPNQITDYNGGTKSYDTSSGYNHQGTDIFIWPYGWKMFNENGLEVIAAAGGQIIYKHDGEFDMNCSFNSSPWNAIYIRHNDGSVAWYGHFKSGTLTTKNVGDTVTEGEYLGVVGSSGNSTGPHLHFEVYEDDTYAYDKLIDPYSGPSNNWNATSWWQSQKPYRNPKINALTTNNEPPVFGDCPSIETPNEKDVFLINDIVHFIVFLKDQLDQTVNFKVYRPDNSLLLDYSFDLVDDYAVSYWYLSEAVDAVGQWRFECTISTGEVMDHYFTVENSLSIDEHLLGNVNVYPNPLKENLYINSEIMLNKLIISDVLGKQLFEFNDSFTGTKKIPVDFLSQGNYFLTVFDDKSNTATFKLIKD